MEENKLIECYKLLNLITQYSKKIMARDISHSLNNLLTPIQIKQQLLSMSIDADNLPDEALKVREIGDNLKIIKKFSTGLIENQNPDFKLDTLPLRILISNLTITLKVLSLSDFCSLKTDFDEKASMPATYPNCLEVLIISFVVRAIKMQGYTDALLTEGPEKDHRTRVISITATPADKKDSGSRPQLIKTLVNLLPLDRVIKVTESETDNISITVIENRVHQLTIVTNYKS